MALQPSLVLIGLGSNLGNRALALQSAVQLLCDSLTDVTVSRVYASPAMLPEDAPQEWDQPFLNMAIGGFSPQSPREILQLCKDVELILGRKKRDFWGPREIDIDLLAVGSQVHHEPDLQLPHIGMLARPFVLLPLLDIAPEWVFPGEGKFKGNTLRQIAAQQQMQLGDGIALDSAKIQCR